MKKKKIYIAGKVTGLPRGQVVELFSRAERKLSQEGWEVMNPLKIVDEKSNWQDAMRLCVMALMECDAIVLLPSWSDSKGARLEYHIAKEMGIEIVI